MAVNFKFFNFQTGQLNTIGSDKPVSFVKFARIFFNAYFYFQSIHLAEEVEEMQMLEVTESDSWKTQENPIINVRKSHDVFLSGSRHDLCYSDRYTFHIPQNSSLDLKNL